MGNKDITGSGFNKILQMMSLNNFAMAFVSVFRYQKIKKDCCLGEQSPPFYNISY